MNKLSIIIAFLGETPNRYMVYQRNRTLAEKFALAKTIPGLDSFKLCCPAAFEKPGDLKALLSQHGFGPLRKWRQLSKMTHAGTAIFIRSGWQSAHGNSCGQESRPGFWS